MSSSGPTRRRHDDDGVMCRGRGVPASHDTHRCGDGLSFKIIIYIWEKRFFFSSLLLLLFILVYASGDVRSELGRFFFFNSPIIRVRTKTTGVKAARLYGPYTYTLWVHARIICETKRNSSHLNTMYDWCVYNRVSRLTDALVYVVVVLLLYIRGLRIQGSLSPPMR